MAVSAFQAKKAEDEFEGGDLSFLSVGEIKCLFLREKNVKTEIN